MIKESISPEIVIKDPYEKHIAKVVERIEALMKYDAEQDAIIDYINVSSVEYYEEYFCTTIITKLEL